MNKISINTEPVELYKILKFESLVDGGGEAKMAIAGGYVAVNEALVTQKRKKIYAGDIIEFNGEFYEIVMADNIEQDSVNTPSNDDSKQQQATAKRRKRSAIRF